MTFDYDLHLLGMDVTFGAFVPLEEMMSPSFVLYTHICGLPKGCFDVLTLYFHFGGIFWGWPMTYLHCIMYLHVLGAS
jgi:hypothetical protein